MNKKELIKCVAEKSGVSIKDTGEVVNTIGSCIGTSLAKGENISLIGFGNFVVKKRAARMGVNPRTGDKIQIKASNAVSFKASKVLKAKCN